MTSLFGVLVVAWFSLSDPSCSGVVDSFEVSWPPTAPVDLDIELRATTRGRDEDKQVMTSAQLSEISSGLSSEDAPGVQVEEQYLAGLYYLEIVLGDVAMDAELPLLVVIHGRGDRPRVPGGPFFGVSAPMRIIAPRAPDKAGRGFTWFPVRTAQSKDSELGVWIKERAAQLAYLIETVLATRPTRGEPIINGFSQGGILTFALALLHPEVVGHAFPLAGWLPPHLVPPALDPTKPYPPIQAMHGKADLIVPYRWTNALVLKLETLGLDVQWRGFPRVKHSMSKPMNALFSDWLRVAVEHQAPTLVSIATVPDLIPMTPEQLLISSDEAFVEPGAERDGGTDAAQPPPDGAAALQTPRDAAVDARAPRPEPRPGPGPEPRTNAGVTETDASVSSKRSPDAALSL